MAANNRHAIPESLDTGRLMASPSRKCRGRALEVEGSISSVMALSAHPLFLFLPPTFSMWADVLLHHSKLAVATLRHWALP